MGSLSSSDPYTASPSRPQGKSGPKFLSYLYLSGECRAGVSAPGFAFSEPVRFGGSPRPPLGVKAHLEQCRQILLRGGREHTETPVLVLHPCRDAQVFPRQPFCAHREIT